MAEIIKQQFGLETDLEPGNRGEFTVWVDGKVVSEKIGDIFPEDAEITAAVSSAL